MSNHPPELNSPALDINVKVDGTADRSKAVRSVALAADEKIAIKMNNRIVDQEVTG